jgi:hypothetical protein
MRPSPRNGLLVLRGRLRRDQARQARLVEHNERQRGNQEGNKHLEQGEAPCR